MNENKLLENLVGMKPHGIKANGTYDAPTGYAYTTIVVRGDADLSKFVGNYLGDLDNTYSDEVVSGYFDSFTISNINGSVIGYLSRRE